MISKGWRLRKTHNLITLLEEVIKYDTSFSDFMELGRRLSAYYMESRYPADAPTIYSEEEIAGVLAQTENLIAKIVKASGVI